MAEKHLEYIDYDVACSNYDYGRKAGGVNEMVGLMYGMVGKPLEQIRLLDAGCGTGNYSKAFLERGVGHATLLDTSQGMLSIASAKLEKEIQNGRVELKHHTLPSLPFPDESFDVITLIHVGNLLDKQPDEGETSYPNFIKFIKEANRVLKKNGILLITMFTQEQIVKSVWYRYLIPKTTRKFQRKYMPVPDVTQLMKDSGFAETAVIYRPGGTANMIDEVYYDIEGPLNEKWRGTSLIWNFVDDDELQSAIQTAAELKKNGKLREFFEEKDIYRQKYGISTDVIGKK